mmetsp:Transcript_22890/g.73709  ORF Transcript_22890/g.73709 Transcript_22890/m.73709 type:complete len:325 (-) Transcript_22890:5-979(-)
MGCGVSVEEAYHRFYVAAEMGDVKEMAAAKTSCKKLDINHRHPETGGPPIFIAAQCGRIEAVRYLLNEGADPNVALVENWISPLNVAAQNGHAAIVKLLIDGGADVNMARADGQTPLLRACQKGHEDCVALLLQANADIDYATPLQGITSLLSSVNFGYANITEMLLRAGANQNKAMHDGAGPLFLAAKKGDLSQVKLLLKYGANVNAVCHSGSVTPLHAAARNAHTEVARLLLEHNADVNAKAVNDVTPLMIAAGRGAADLCELLLSYGADANARAADGATAATAAEDSATNPPAGLTSSDFYALANMLRGHMTEEGADDSME